ncbi:MAG: glycosyltransferase N-terminal domain-containing protein [Paracoccaceae bacterium]
MIVYRLLLACLSPFVGLVWVLRRATGRAGPGELAQRLAHDLPTLPATRCLWLHGASNGELTSARRLIAAILDRRPDLGLVVTANTMTGCELVRGWRLPRTAVTLAPFDDRQGSTGF